MKTGPSSRRDRNDLEIILRFTVDMLRSNDLDDLLWANTPRQNIERSGYFNIGLADTMVSGYDLNQKSR